MQSAPPTKVPAGNIWCVTPGPPALSTPLSITATVIPVPSMPGKASSAVFGESSVLARARMTRKLVSIMPKAGARCSTIATSGRAAIEASSETDTSSTTANVTNSLK